MRPVENDIPRVVLLRVGVDAGEGGIQGPLFRDGSFDYVPIPDSRNLTNLTYGEKRGRHGRLLCDYWRAGKRREKYRKQTIHFDPEFVTFTYGDPTIPKQSLRRLQPGDLLVFYAGLQPWSKVRGFHGDPHLYIIGYFVVRVVGHAVGLFQQYSRSEIKRIFANSPHLVKGAKISDRLILIQGTAASRLLVKAHRLSEYGKDRNGLRIKVLRRGLKKHFGTFTKTNYLQRSPPRWVSPKFSKKAYDYIVTLR
jgi:hypothetical protein